MAEEGFKRKLAAILSADVEGYSRLMDDNEEATVRTLTSYRSVITDLVQQYRGRVVDSPGDNILAEFASVVDSVNCAVEIQRDLAERNAELPYKRQMQFRIGVNLGDVIEEEGRIYGDGVNIAARVESLAEAGGICISSRAYEQVMNKLGLEYEDLGEHQVKNISLPIRVYRVLSFPGAAAHRVVQAKESLGKKWHKIAISAVALIAILGGLAYWQFYMHSPDVDPASLDKMAFPLPEKPSIAVLPFVNMSEDPKQEYFSDGITEQIISTLSKVPSMFVIARTSTFAYKDKQVKVQQVSEELGVRYVLEGSVQRSGDRVRITAQLIDAIDGKHMWTKRYDQEIKDIFKLQDEITLKIITALRVKLTVGEQANIWDKNAPSNVEYVEKFFEALFYGRQFNKESNLKTKQLCEELIDLEPEYWVAYVGLAMTHNLDVWLGSSSSPRESLGKAFKLCQKAISLDEKQDVPHLVIGNIYLLMRKYDLAIKEIKRAIALNPNSAEGYVYLGQSLAFSGRPEEGIESIKKGMRLSPFPVIFSIHNLATAYREAGRYEEAIAEYKKAIKLAPNNSLVYIALSMTYALHGRFEEAREAYSELLKIDPDYSLEKGLKIFPFKPERYKVIRAAFQKAGILGKPPLPQPDKPTIAVLPFVNMSGDPEQEYFSDGMTDDIITDLSKISGLMVISSSSAFTYKGKEIRIPVIAKELGVKYVLEGSVRRAGNEVRINAQLIDADTDHHIWANRFDGKNENIFALQDRITERIVSALAVKLSPSEQKVMAEKGTSNMVAYDTFLKAMNHLRKFTPKDYVKAIDYFKKAIDLDPSYIDAYANLAYTYYRAYMGGPKFMHEIGKPGRILRLWARHYAEKAMKQPTARGYQVMASLELDKRNFKKAIDNAEHAVSIAPNDADAFYTLGRVMVYTDNPEKGMTYYKKSIMLDPLHKSTDGIGFAYFVMGDYESAVKYIEKFFKDYSECAAIRSCLAASYAFLGNDIKAKEEFENWFT